MRRAQVIAYVTLVGCAFWAGAAYASALGAVEAYPPFGLAEGSGMAASVLHDGVVWVVEDGVSDQSLPPVVHGYDPSGAEVGTVTLAGWNNRDVEAMSIGPGPTVWVADIGDNNAGRESVVVHTFVEPDPLGEITLEPVSYRLRYPDGAHDAETIIVDPVEGRVYIATKSPFGDGALYIAPPDLVAGGTHDLTLVTSVPSWITDGSFTPDGTQLLLLRALPRVSTDALVHDVSRPGGGAPLGLTQVAEIPLPTQEQSEMLTVTMDGESLLVGSEGRDEPVWSVPLSAATAATTAAPDPESPDPVDEPVATTIAVDTSADCRLSDPMSCLDEPTGWLTALAVVLVALMITMVVMLRRTRRSP